MSGERFFVTGALGCIGAWVTRNVLRAGQAVTVFDLGSDRKRLQLILEPAELQQIDFVQGDVTDTAAVEAALCASGATRVIHLAALQVPFCKANPPLGASVNVIGTINVFEAARALGIPHIVYASSAAVYGSGADYERDILENDAPFLPRNLYGVFKLANQGTAQIYHQDYGINSIGLRPYTVYGPGRDQGMTSTPTRAMLAAAAGSALAHFLRRPQRLPVRRRRRQNLHSGRQPAGLAGGGVLQPGRLNCAHERSGRSH